MQTNLRIVWLRILLVGISAIFYVSNELTCLDVLNSNTLSIVLDVTESFSWNERLGLLDYFKKGLA